MAIAYTSCYHFGFLNANKMEIELATKIVNCKNQILENNKIIAEKSKENEKIP